MKEAYYKVHTTDSDKIKDLAEYIVANKENPEVIAEFFDALQDYFVDKMEELYERGRDDMKKEIQLQRLRDFQEEVDKGPRL